MDGEGNEYRFVFILPYENQVDRYRNVPAVGQGAVVWRDKEYAVDGTDRGAGHFIQMKSSRVIGRSV
jgi:hypothetical protein